MRRLSKGRVQAIRAANDQGHIVTAQLPAFEPVGQGLGGEVGATLIQRHHAGATRNGGLDALAFSGVQGVQRFGATRLGLHSLELHFEFRRKTLGVVVVRSLGPIGHPLPHGNNQQLHGST